MLFPTVEYALFFVCALLTLAGCDPLRNMQGAQASAPECDVRALPGTATQFLARCPDGRVWLLEVEGIDGKLRNKILLFGAAP